jgi:diacylglycerol kinase family enzyme
MPQVGVLKLGTGNAMARALGAGRPLTDANHICGQGEARPVQMDLVETEEGLTTPFAGMGYDGEILNDYVWLKENASTPFTKAVAESVLGYLVGMITRTVPREMSEPSAQLRIVSNHDAIKMVRRNGVDVEEIVPAGTVLFQGVASTTSVSTIPYYGFGFTMFPFASSKPGMMQLRVVALTIPTILTNLYPAIWKGTFRHPDLHDFLVKDVTVESDKPLPYQVGGDAAGSRRKLSFKVADKPLEMVALGARSPAAKQQLFGLLPAPRWSARSK